MSTITEDLEKSEIKNIDVVVFSYLISKSANLLKVYGIIMVISFIFNVFTNGNYVGFTIFIMALPVFVGIGSYMLAMRDVQHIFMKQIAETLRFTYSNSGDISTINPVLLGNVYGITDILVGTYNNLPARIFNQLLRLSQGDIHANVRTVFEIELGQNFPTIAVLGHIGTQGISSKLENVKNIKMEGNFSQNFNVWMQNDCELEGYEILTPDIMKEFEDSTTLCNVLISENKLYIFTSKLITTKQEFIDADRLISRVIKEWIPVIKGATPIENKNI